MPTLILENGEALFDSPVICEYLDSLHTGSKLFPVEGSARWRALRLQAMADGLLDASLSRRNELLRPEQEQSAAWIERQIRAVRGACAWLEARVATELDGGRVTIGHIAVACALGYFALRFPEEGWEAEYPRLAAWHARFDQRPSLYATRYDVLKQALPPHLAKEGPPPKH